ncbi:hypothetical protein [Streptomyces sp. NPDC056165]|uniref:hypothetical protein n=1 Tax=Streptomyces sp. NPDC056165 TaxID=3345733 RepID=UPI0035E1DC15
MPAASARRAPIRPASELADRIGADGGQDAIAQDLPAVSETPHDVIHRRYHGCIAGREEAANAKISKYLWKTVT